MGVAPKFPITEPNLALRRDLGKAIMNVEFCCAFVVDIFVGIVLKVLLAIWGKDIKLQAKHWS